MFLASQRAYRHRSQTTHSSKILLAHEFESFVAAALRQCLPSSVTVAFSLVFRPTLLRRPQILSIKSLLSACCGTLLDPPHILSTFRLYHLPYSIMTTGSVLLAPSAAKQNYDLMYYLKGAAAGGICCSITHAALTPVDVVKTRVQLDPVKVSGSMTQLKYGCMA
jgi:hypothetical protein